MTTQQAIASNFAQQYGPWALIAGGSEGIGASFATQLADLGINLVLLARREQPLEQLAEILRRDHAVEVRALAVDLTDPALLGKLASSTGDIDVGLMIYNAGATIGYNRFTDWSPEDLDFMINLNCRAPVQLAHHFARGMVNRGRGGMLFLTSAAAFAGSAWMSIYPATKAFDHILAEGLWHDLKPAGVDCLSLVVGATRTPSHAHIDFSKWNPDMKDGGAMACDDVAAEGLAQLGRTPTWIVGEHNRARYAESFPRDRIEAIEAMSLGTALINDLPHIPAVRD
jgi:short-subunit dehydrogenase